MADELKHLTVGTILSQAEYEAIGGHVFDSQAQGDILYASSTSQLSRLGKDANATRALTNTGTNNNPVWAQIALATGVSGTLPVGNGGTGATTLTDKAVLISQDSGTDTLGSVALTTSGQVIIGGSSGPAAAVLTAGSNVTITNGDGSISIAAAGGAVTREGGQTTEGTSTSTSQADILASSSLTVQATEPFYFIFNARKTAGAVTAVALQLKVNSTSLNTVGGPGGTTDLWGTSSTNQAENGVVAIFTGSRVTNYQAPMTAVRGVYPSVAGIGTIDFTNVTEMIRSAVIPIAEITALTVIGLTDSASITIGVDEAHVYSYAAS